MVWVVGWRGGGERGAVVVSWVGRCGVGRERAEGERGGE